jgi:hypothetical protein
MPRDLAGNYTLPTPVNPVVTGTTITTTWWNTTGGDLATALTNSFDRTGATGGMTGQFKAVSGTAGAPGISFQIETSSGLYWANTGDVRFSLQGNDLLKWTSSAITAFQTIIATGGAPNGRGGTFTATGAEQGIVGTGGNGAGNAGTWGIAGGSTGFGLIGQGVSGGVGAYAYSSSVSVDVLRADGYVDLSHAGTVAVNTPFTNHLTPKNVCKVWALLHTDGLGNITAVEGFNVSGVSVASATVTLDFATNFASTNYAVVGNGGAASLGQPIVIQNTRAVGSCTFKLWDANAGTLYNLATVAMDIIVHIYGAQ